MGVVEQIRKAAAVEAGRQAFGELTSSAVSAVDQVLMQKAGAADQALLIIAAVIRPDRPLTTYEELGGQY
jgi:hypothetical protein